ncbi:thioredoxin family protein [Tenacibaculum jejuense]|uniref:Thioredoxin domain containing protein n=1 Tax=Tenacibaculum jejuense TaxID=584609 RepID=A0A238U7K5_9FLAO|nr:thioredoxin family protein [Tenacibaculum jejuense]SNR15147.1 Thioredoxin domain containing protein [Tenacibaculum jejuense]
MKIRIIFIIFLLLLTQFTFSQEINMIKDWDEAKTIATKENKQILIILTGSEWCAPCRKMDKKVIAHHEFQDYAKKNLVLFLIDLPGGGIIYNSKVNQDYEKFKSKFQADALPSLILTDKNGIKIKNLKGKMHRLKNVMKQLKSNRSS